MNSRKLQLVVNYILFEFGLLNFCLILAFAVKSPEVISAPFNLGSLWHFVKLSGIFNLAWSLVLIFNFNYNFYLNYSFRQRIKYIGLNTILFIGFISTMAIFLQLEYFNRTVFFLPIFVYSFLNIFFFCYIFEFLHRQKKRSLQSKVLVIGNGNADKLVDFSRIIKLNGYQMEGVLMEKELIKPNKQINVLGTIPELNKVLSGRNIDEIFIANNNLSTSELDRITNVADFNGVRVSVVPEHFVTPAKQFQLEEQGLLPKLIYRKTPLDHLPNFMIKKIFDVLFASIVIILLAPVLLLIALLIKIDSGGSIFYTPLRKGEGGRTFKCYKFRTMSVCDDPVNGTRSTIKDDPRITRIGKYLRKYDLDELPQFFNVLKGDMSVVGPRPHRVNLQEDFRKSVNDYMVRHYIKPGITGWAQVNGWRGPTQTIEQKRQRVRHDIHYIEHWNFSSDIRIIFLTVFGRKTRRNAF